ncbi:hypothetical protein L873DRAFT_315422 [Choiromyces venosus 120613-1]|uniref:Uncharacterized protein n=1 Tax=Choiromyces venosus 120613-1 TaxID=1336337 RepID=A0A3N4J2D7_9PEZI|nr:hypothetical protein L873DRAFT_315422 [Choiromyces venosus 120613-1]
MTFDSRWEGLRIRWVSTLLLLSAIILIGLILPEVIDGYGIPILDFIAIGITAIHASIDTILSCNSHLRPLYVVIMSPLMLVLWLYLLAVQSINIYSNIDVGILVVKIFISILYIFAIALSGKAVKRLRRRNLPPPLPSVEDQDFGPSGMVCQGCGAQMVLNGCTSVTCPYRPDRGENGGSAYAPPYVPPYVPPYGTPYVPPEPYPEMSAERAVRAGAEMAAIVPTEMAAVAPAGRWNPCHYP